MTVNFTAVDVAKKALELIDANPDYVYDSPTGDCHYAHAEAPSCLFGQAFAALGFHVPQEWEGKAVDEVLRRLYDPETEYDLGVHPARWGGLSRAQLGQDDGAAWGSNEVRGNVVEWLEANS